MRDKRFKRVIRNFILILFLGSVIVVNIPVLRSTPMLDYFPDGDWRTSTPEEQGMDSNRLDEMYTKIKKYEIGIDSIHIITNGYLVYEEYFDYYNYSNLHNPMSTTKSVISILIGIANATGLITNLDQPVLDIFTNRTFVNVDARKQALTIRHLLKMQMGVDWKDVQFIEDLDPFDYENLSNMTADRWENLPVNLDNDFMQMLNSDDRVQYVLDKPLIYDPGTVWHYNCGAAHLLSAIIQIKTGMSTANFAKSHLFDPLNITNYYWWNDSMGISTGDGGLWLQPIDMAKFGYLCLNNGTWNGNQVVPKEWIQESIIPHTPSAMQDSYGYLWWINIPLNYYWAWGLGGQYIMVKPDKKMVVVFTGNMYTQGTGPAQFIRDYILKSFEKPKTTTGQLTSSTTSSSDTSAFPFIPIVFCLLLLTIRYRKKNSK